MHDERYRFWTMASPPSARTTRQLSTDPSWYPASPVYSNTRLAPISPAQLQALSESARSDDKGSGCCIPRVSSRRHTTSGRVALSPDYPRSRGLTSGGVFLGLQPPPPPRTARGASLHLGTPGGVALGSWHRALGTSGGVALGPKYHVFQTQGISGGRR